MTRILSSLSKSYNPLITAWNLLPQVQQFLEILKLKLFEEEDHLNEQNKTEEDTKAFAAWLANRTRSVAGGSNIRHTSTSNITPGRSIYAPTSGGRYVPTPVNTPNSSGRYTPA
jgi:hypothetical protein